MREKFARYGKRDRIIFGNLVTHESSSAPLRGFLVIRLLWLLARVNLRLRIWSGFDRHASGAMGISARKSVLAHLRRCQRLTPDPVWNPAVIRLVAVFVPMRFSGAAFSAPD